MDFCLKSNRIGTERAGEKEKRGKSIIQFIQNMEKLVKMD